MKGVTERIFAGFDRTTLYIDKGVQVVIGLAMLAMFGLLLLSVLSRYVIATPFFWLTEGAGYLSALVGLWGSSSCIRYGGHMQVHILQDQFKKYYVGRRILAPLFLIIVNSMVVYYSYALFIRAGFSFADMGRTEYSPSGFFIVFWPRMIMPVGGILISLQALNLISKGFLEFFKKEETTGKEE